MNRLKNAARLIPAAGVDVHRGELTDLDSLRRGAAACDGVIHCAFSHDDFNDYAGNCAKDRGAIDTPASSALTQARFGWKPEQPGLLADLEHGTHFARS
ncbi:hypothetical protein [Sorangium sp. So ce854]|uniref:hypothetical protein n=1 Tax=Sorangium sp. So ce854 TaxID=3133322 RepID=UPI003F5FD523